MTADPTVPSLVARRSLGSSSMRFHLDVLGIDAAVPAATDVDAATRCDADVRALVEEAVDAGRENASPHAERD